MCSSCTAVFAGCCALWGMYKCAKCRCRDVPCVKRLMRCCGCDAFDDFDIVIVVHEAMYTVAGGKRTTCIRLTAGRHQVCTDENSSGRFHQPLELFVEQGTSHVMLELMDASSRKVMANLKLDPLRDVLSVPDREKAVQEKEFAMKPKSKGVINPRVKLTIRRDMLGTEEEGLLSNIQTSTPETTMLLREQLQRAQPTADSMASEVELLMRGCSGPLETFGKWGSRERVYVAARGPPAHKRYTLGIWPDRNSHDKGKSLTEEIDLLKVQSVQPDPSRDEVFIISYVQLDKVKKRMTFARVDRSRDVWVEMLYLLIRKVRDDREARKRDA